MRVSRACDHGFRLDCRIAIREFDELIPYRKSAWRSDNLFNRNPEATTHKWQCAIIEIFDQLSAPFDVEQRAVFEIDKLEPYTVICHDVSECVVKTVALVVRELECAVVLDRNEAGHTAAMVDIDTGTWIIFKLCGAR